MDLAPKSGDKVRMTKMSEQEMTQAGKQNERRTQMKRLMTKVLACAVGLFLLGAVNVWAADPDTDTLTIVITPSVDYGVDIDDSLAVMEDGVALTKTAGLNAEVFLSDPAKLTILGNFDNQEVSVSAAV